MNIYKILQNVSLTKEKKKRFSDKYGEMLQQDSPESLIEETLSLSKLSTGEFFGEGDLLTSITQRPYTILSKSTKLVVFFVNKELFLRLFKEKAYLKRHFEFRAKAHESWLQTQVTKLMKKHSLPPEEKKQAPTLRKKSLSFCNLRIQVEDLDKEKTQSQKILKVIENNKAYVAKVFNENSRIKLDIVSGYVSGIRKPGFKVKEKVIRDNSIGHLVKRIQSATFHSHQRPKSCLDRNIFSQTMRGKKEIGKDKGRIRSFSVQRNGVGNLMSPNGMVNLPIPTPFNKRKLKRTKHSMFLMIGNKGEISREFS